MVPSWPLGLLGFGAGEQVLPALPGQAAGAALPALVLPGHGQGGWAGTGARLAGGEREVRVAGSTATAAWVQNRGC